MQRDGTRGPLTHGRHLPELDGIRAFAIIPVIVFHCRTVAKVQAPFDNAYLHLARAGWIGVDLFFVLSGFLITGILLDTVGSPRYFRSFYLRRVLRICPLYYAALGVTAVCVHVLTIDRLALTSVWVELAHWLYLQNWLPLFNIETGHLGHFWSLGVEEQFYLCWPVLILLAARRGVARQLCLMAILFAVVMRIIFWSLGQSQAGNFATVTRIDTLAVGAYLACLWRDRESSSLSRRHVWLLLGGTGLVLVGVTVYGRGFFRPTNPHIFLFGLLPLALFFGGFLALALTADAHGGFRRMLRSRPLRKLGIISYGVYVVHYPLVVLLEPFWQMLPGGFWTKQLTFLGAITAMSIAIAALSYRFFESPFLRLKSRLAPESAERYAVSSAETLVGAPALSK